MSNNAAKYKLKPCEMKNDDTLGSEGESGAHIYRRSFYDPQV